MGGFLLNLKGKVQKPGKPGNRQLKKPTIGNNALRKNLLGENEDAESNTKTSIDAFLKKGAIAGESAVDQPKELIIKPTKLTTGLLRRKKDTRSKDAVNDTVEDEARLSLLKGETFGADSGLVIASEDAEELEPVENDYNEVPVDQFGAALLRGMGWDGKDNLKEDKAISHRQRGAVLGIGSKPLKEDLEKEIMGDKNTKLQAPLKKRET